MQKKALKIESSKMNPKELISTKEAGTLIRKARERKNISIADLAAGLRIGKEQIIALENGHSDLLPEEVFLKGIIKKIAEYLSINPYDLASKSITQSKKIFDSNSIESKNSIANKLFRFFRFKKTSRNINLEKDAREITSNKSRKVGIKISKNQSKRNDYKEIILIIKGGEIREKIIVRVDGKIIRRKRRWNLKML